MKEQIWSIPGEFIILGIGKVDGCCHGTNTSYEYHGNPSIYDPTDINKVTGKTFGELYVRTIERDNKIREMGNR
jgi:hypothetical protein